MPGREYSKELIEFVGVTELKALEARDSWGEYSTFRDRERGLPQGLSGEERRLARDYLFRRSRDTRPSNMGSASGEAGEAD